MIGSNGLPLDNPTISTNPTLVGGIVEFCVKGMRNVICDNSWSYFDAMVGCRGLGYSPYGKILLRSDCNIINFNYVGALPTGRHYLSFFSNTPLLTNLGCYGNENSLVECIGNNKSGQVNFRSNNIAGLVCHSS